MAFVSQKRSKSMRRYSRAPCRFTEIRTRPSRRAIKIVKKMVRSRPKFS